MNSLRKTSLWAGVLYIITFVSIPTLALYGPVHEANFMLGSGSDTGVFVGGILELIVALAAIGTAVALYPVVKRQNQGVALGFVGTRVLEGTLIFAGVASLLTVVALRQTGVGADGLVTGQAFVGLYDKTFLVSQSLIPAVNALLLGSLLYRSHLVSRVLPVIGLIGAPLLIVGVIGTIFGAWEPASTQTLLLAFPIAVWEFSLGVYLIVKGFRPSPITDGMVA
ncbi:MAG: DUF4386 domain-containing protein [Acidimicrobiia bacterium]